MRNWIMGLLGVAIIGCTTTEISEKTKQHDVTILHQSNRGGRIEPCGCEMNPYGGIDRELNAVRFIRRNEVPVLYLDSGNLFYSSYSKGPIVHHRKKAEAMVEMINKLQMDAFSPGPSDYKLGVETLKRIAQKSNFRFISTNVVTEQGQTLFEKSLILEKDGIRYALISLTPPLANGDGGGLKVLPYEEVMAAMLPELQLKSDFVIVLSQLGSIEDQKMAKKFPEIPLIIGADFHRAYDHGMYLNEGKTLLIDTNFDGALLGKLDLTMLLPFQGYTSKTMVGSNLKEDKWREEYAKAHPEDKPMQQYLINFKKTALLSDRLGGTEFAHELIQLDKASFGTPNEVSKLMKAEKERVRTQALSE